MTPVRHAVQSIQLTLTQLSQGSSMHMTLRPSAKRNALRSTLTAYAYTGSSENTNKSKKRKIHKVNAPILEVQNDNEESLVTPNANWNEMLLKIREMRVTLRAEVDEDGAEVVHFHFFFLILLGPLNIDFL